MAIIRCTLFFEQGKYGWTESYWTNAASLTDPAMQARGLQLAQKRIKVSGAHTTLPYMRYSVEGVFRDAFFNVLPSNGLVGTINKISDAPSTALLCTQKTADNSKSRNIYLRGIWDDVVHNGGEYVPAPDFSAAFDDYRTRLIADAWGWLGVASKDVGNAATVVQNLNGTVTVTTVENMFDAPHPRNGRVSISGMQGSTQLNGQQRVRITAANSFTTRDRIAIFDYLTGGTITEVTLGFQQISQVNLSRVVRRKAGRPSFVSAGRL